MHLHMYFTYAFTHVFYICIYTYILHMHLHIHFAYHTCFPMCLRIGAVDYLSGWRRRTRPSPHSWDPSSISPKPFRGGRGTCQGWSHALPSWWWWWWWWRIPRRRVPCPAGIDGGTASGVDWWDYHLRIGAAHQLHASPTRYRRMCPCKKVHYIAEF